MRLFILQLLLGRAVTVVSLCSPCYFLKLDSCEENQAAVFVMLCICKSVTKLLSSTLCVTDRVFRDSLEHLKYTISVECTLYSLIITPNSSLIQ